MCPFCWVNLLYLNRVAKISPRSSAICLCLTVCCDALMAVAKAVHTVKWIQNTQRLKTAFKKLKYGASHHSK